MKTENGKKLYNFLHFENTSFQVLAIILSGIESPLEGIAYLLQHINTVGRAHMVWDAVIHLISEIGYKFNDFRKEEIKNLINRNLYEFTPLVAVYMAIGEEFSVIEFLKQHATGTDGATIRKTNNVLREAISRGLATKESVVRDLTIFAQTEAEIAYGLLATSMATVATEASHGTSGSLGEFLGMTVDELRAMRPPVVERKPQPQGHVVHRITFGDDFWYGHTCHICGGLPVLNVLGQSPHPKAKEWLLIRVEVECENCGQVTVPAQEIGRETETLSKNLNVRSIPRSYVVQEGDGKIRPADLL